MTNIQREINSAIERNTPKDQLERKIAEIILTKERASHNEIKVNLSDRNGYEIRAQQCPLDIYYNKGLLGADRKLAFRRYRAGDRFYREFYLAGIVHGMTISLDRVYSQDKREYMPVNERQREALDSWRGALTSLHNDTGKFIAINVLCYGYPLSNLEIKNYKRGKDAMPRFLEVLDDLLSHYCV